MRGGAVAALHKSLRQVLNAVERELPGAQVDGLVGDAHGRRRQRGQQRLAQHEAAHVGGVVHSERVADPSADVVPNDVDATAQPRSATASTAGGHTVERAEFKEVTFAKVADLASPILMQTCAMGKTITKAKLEYGADGHGEKGKYYPFRTRQAVSTAAARSVAGTWLLTK
jgi:hypothetical protein